MNFDRDKHFMQIALAQAQQASACGEVPVGAVIVQCGIAERADRVIAAAHNQPVGLKDPTAHAEMLALRQAAQALGNYRLDGCELFVTLEPCAMCAQALLHARIARVVYGAAEPKTGAAGSVVNILGDARLNHQTQVQGGVLADAAAALLQGFFTQQRRAARQSAQPLRDDALRTPDAAFAPLWQALPDGWREASQTTQAGSELNGLRFHWIDLQPQTPPPSPSLPSSPATGSAWVLLHGPASWWPEWLALAQSLTRAGHRVLLPDLIGCGLSDKPKKPQWHTMQRHAAILAQWLKGLGEPVWQVGVAPEQADLGQHVVRSLQAHHDLPATLAVIEAPIHAHLPAGWQHWPYPDQGHRAAHKAWPWPPS